MPFQVGNIASTKSKQISALQKMGLFTIEITVIVNAIVKFNPKFYQTIGK